jgi:hypothetical protein
VRDGSDGRALRWPRALIFIGSCAGAYGVMGTPLGSKGGFAPVQAVGGIALAVALAVVALRMASSRGGGSRVLATEVAACWVFAFLVGGVVGPVLASARAASSGATCGIKVKLLGVAALAYASDHDEHLPLARGWHSALVPYQPPLEGLRCADRVQTHGFAYNQAVAGMRLDDLRHRGRIVVFFEARGEGAVEGAQPSDAVAAHGGKPRAFYLHGGLASLGEDAQFGATP